LPSNLAHYFDSVIPWEKRLKREMPLLEALGRNAGGRVLVPACGTGGHVVALAERGFDVLGFDIDEDALALARGKTDAAALNIAASSGKAEIRLLEMAQASELGPHYDVALVLGNALPGMSQPGQLLASLRGVAGALRPGGVFLTQNLNYDLRWREKTQFFPVLAGQTADEDVLLVKFADYDAEFINFHAMFLARPKSGGAWQSHLRSSRQMPLFQDRLTAVLADAGFEGFQYWGDFAQTPFDPTKSNDLIVSARRQV
jgi:SAM-dependent methyltransferase